MANVVCYSICASVAAVTAFSISLIYSNFISPYFCKRIEPSEYRSNNTFEWDSSVRCHRSNGSLLCTFQNICYLPDGNQFLFRLTEHSVLHGLTSKEDFKTIRLSSVLNHNLMYMKIVIVSNEFKLLETVSFINYRLFLLWRFKWDNVMHILHDDLLPLFLTYLDICGDIKSCVPKYTLGFVDQGEFGPYDELYSLFSYQQPLLLHNYKKSVCFHEVQAGILDSSIWFQYGFGREQGPVNSNVPIKIIHEFKDFIIQKYGISQKNSNNSVILLFNRKLNRRILNIDSFTKMIYETVQRMLPSSQPTIIEVDLSTHNVSSIIENLLTTKIVVGIHGSAMILCLFLMPGSIVIELFPFGIQPEYVSFIKPFSNIIGSGIIYRSWVNQNETLSHPHPEALPLLGGIYHLPRSKQELILNTKTVPAVKCCHEPMYLYRMFQDTVVGSDFKSIFQEALLEQKKFSKDSFSTAYMDYLLSCWYFPAPVTNVICSFYQNSVYASWQPPVNAVKSLAYDITVLLNDSTSFTKRTSNSHLKIDLDYTILSAQLWIKSHTEDSESVDSYTLCLSKNI